MNPLTHIMAEIKRLQVENNQIRRTDMIREMSLTDVMKGEPPHYHPISTLDPPAKVMFSDDNGFEQFAGPDYGMNTRAEKAGFMSIDGESWVQNNRHRFYSYPIDIGNRFFD